MSVTKVQGPRIGKYELLERLGAGGMAEVFRARVKGAAGFEKDVALKMIRSEWITDASLVTMFVDEACVSAGLSHPNVVQTQDFGCVSGRYFIAMELVDGVSMRDVMKWMSDKKIRLDWALACHVTAEVSAALDYAHAASDKDGKPLGIVHRDVNPANVMVSRHGQVKLADFGIAKVAGRSSMTEAGALKGKIAYMSPEQAWGRSLDARSDVFALGLMLQEFLTGERALEAESDMATLEKARAAQVSPLPDLGIDPAIDALLRTTIGGALRRDPGDRFERASAFRAQLLELLADAPRRDLAAEIGVLVAQILSARPATKVELGVNIAIEGTEPGTQPGTVVPAIQPPPRGWAWRSGIAGAAIVGLASWALIARSSRTPTSVAEFPSVAAPIAPAAVATVPTPTATTLLAPAPSAPPDPKQIETAPSSGPKRKASQRILTQPMAKAPSGEHGTLRIQIQPWGSVRLDDRDLGMTPLKPIDIPPGPHVVMANNPTLGSRTKKIVVRPGEAQLVTLDLRQKEN